MRCCLAIAALLVSLSAFADDCDIVLQPAATLLLPYFEVDFKAQQQAATQTLFTIQNTSHLPQIAHVTVWTDWGFPALNSPVFLTGYDVQGINLYDVFARATIAGQFGTSSNTAVPTNPTPGSQPAGNDANPQLMNAHRRHARSFPAVSLRFCSRTSSSFSRPALPTPAIAPSLRGSAASTRTPSAT